MSGAAAAQNSKPPARRVVGRPFKPGQSGNPGGRPAGLAARVREVAPAGKLAEYYLAIWTLNKTALRKLKIDPAECTLQERNKAAEWLADRGYGKAPAHAPLEGGDPLELDEVDRAIDKAVDELAARREAASTREAAGGGLAGDGQARAASAGG